MVLFAAASSLDGRGGGPIPGDTSMTPDHDNNPYTSPAARRAYLNQLDQIATLSEVDRDLVRLGQMPGLWRWIEQITATGGCAHPIYLRGHSTTIDTTTGEVVRHYTTRDEPGERLAVRCRNRRAGRCPSCSYQYQGDTFQLVRAGLIGGKGVPDSVREHPRVFATLTAPSFGQVHRAGPCHPGRRPSCEHTNPLGCGLVHADDDPLVGQALCLGCYDYTGHVLWNAHAGTLWKAFRDNLYHHLAARVGASRTAVRRQVRVSAAKVAEYQRRGAIHFHAVLRLDGPDGPGSTPPPWATVELLLTVIETAAAAVALQAPDSAAYGERQLIFGDQLEAHALTHGDGGRITDDQVAAYVAKYTTKSVETAGALDKRIESYRQIRTMPVSGHVRALVGTSWRLGGLPQLETLRLRDCAHMLGYRGHCLSKTHAYSTTYGTLRAVRVAHRTDAPLADAETVTESAWRYAGSGHTPGGASLAAGISEAIIQNREIAREALAEADGGVIG